jgi:hypothetical protein
VIALQGIAKQANLLNPDERKYLYTLFLVALVFSIWFYLGLTSKDRFALAHGYGGVSEAKELIGIMGIAFAFVISLIRYQYNKKSTGFLLITFGLGLILARSILHSTHMINAMEPNSLLIEAIFEGENHLLLSMFDALGAVFIALGVTSFLIDRHGSYLFILVVSILDIALLIMILFKGGGDIMLFLNNMVVSHGRALLPLSIALIPILAFFVPTILSYKRFKEKPDDFTRLLFLGIGLIFLRAVVHGVHTVFGLETHFFQSGFDLLGGVVIGLAYYRDIEKKDSSFALWVSAGLFLIFALVYFTFTYLKFR